MLFYTLHYHSDEKKRFRQISPIVIRTTVLTVHHIPSISEKLMLVTEYCCTDNLQKFLIKSRVIDKSATADSQNVCKTSLLNSRQLMKFCVDVASGMVHLSNLKVY